MRRPRTKAGLPTFITVDFETGVIKKRPAYPPEAVGCALQWPQDKKPTYYAWAHPIKNNCTKAQGVAAVKAAWMAVKKGDVDALLFQNGKFDVDVAETHYGCPVLHWTQIHELQYLIFLNDPHSYNLQLKSQAKQLLGIEPEEKNEATDWLEKDFKRTKVDPREWVEGKEPRSDPKAPWNDYKGEKHKWYAYVGLAPGDIVGKLACGDIMRTKKLFELLYPIILKKGMGTAYDRERRLMRVLLENERQGVRVDVVALEKDIAIYAKALADCEAWMRKRLKAPKLNFNSDKDFGELLAKHKLVDDDKWVWTKGGANTPPIRSVSKKNLTPDMVNDPRVAQMYGYRNRLVTCLFMFMKTWHRQAIQTGGYIHTNWKQVKASDFGGGDAGAATGRLSSSPNFQNIPKSMEDKGDGFVHPAWSGLPQLPHLRKYMLPDEGHVWGHRDYSQQELRIFAHFAETFDPTLAQMYRDNPDLDVHGIVDAGLQENGIHFIRTFVKNFVFQKLYGGGIPAVTEALHTTAAIAKKCIAIIMDYLPGYQDLDSDVKGRVAEEGGYVTTWGGRQYEKEASRYSPTHKRVMDFAYKILNYLIQGSAADCTKEALIRYHEHPKRQARLLLSVHDEINISIPAHRVLEELAILGECMESVEFDLPMLSEAKAGTRWSTSGKVYKDKAGKLWALQGKAAEGKPVTFMPTIGKETAKVVPFPTFKRDYKKAA